MDFDLENPLTISHDFQPETITSLFAIESDHMPSDTYLQSLKARNFDISIRREAIASISQQPKPWLIKLLAMSCISLASKMKKSEFSLLDVQGDGGIIFDTQTIQRMELLILGALKWRMRSITPFSFMSFVISLFKLEDPPLLHALKARATQIIFKSQKDIELLVFKPSIIAASAVLSASDELLPMQFPCFKKALSNCSYVNKENMLQCYSAMQDIVVDGFDSVLERVCSSFVTPANVLDHTFSSSAESGKTTVTSISTLRLERDLKRRKNSEYCKDHRLQISHKHFQSHKRC
ncbi:putative cyclin-D6-1 isoform X2 [Malus sylvestris]|uniref:putative cyclin-D6-1 isoform X2 n=1 Tax=Malus sylvestris TaxID=3752 RepID=UPI0021ACC360|nr:putative cyclin-D6-1 isoform X2 [Malus sylvestris]